MKTTIILDSNSIVSHFTRLCQNYSKLSFAVAWCGDPSEGFPYSYLKQLRGAIVGIVGIDFCHSHPKGLLELNDLCGELRIATPREGIFHPKLFLFETASRAAIWIGSSNLTKTGFSTNDEACLLIEGSFAELADQVSAIREAFRRWSSDSSSFKFSDRWLKSYRQRFDRTQRLLINKARHSNPSGKENEKVRLSTFLMSATWEDYYARVKAGQQDDSEYWGNATDGWIEVLEARKALLPGGWRPSSFDNLELRKFMAGSGDYGSFGHVGASGGFLHLLANGTQRQKEVMATAFERIKRIELPGGESALSVELEMLTSLGPSMKVWGRMLLLLRPDYYFTVSHPNLRRNLANELSMTQAEFATIEGYIQAIQLIHRTVWFNSPKPSTKEERYVWVNRAAFIDAVLRDA